MHKVVKTLLVLMFACILLTQVSEAARRRGGKRRRCPRTEDRFDTRLANCYRPLYTNFRVDRPEEYCPRYRSILKCAERLIRRCSDKDWVQARRQQLEEEVLQGLREELTGCPDESTTSNNDNDNNSNSTDDEENLWQSMQQQRRP